jgi:adenine-specific DNA-methyltransferase
MAGVVSLSSPEENYGVLDNEYVSELIATIRKLKSPQSITIFTNRGVELAWESKPEDVEIIKVPHAIFAELER